LLPTLGYAADKPRNPVTSTKRFNSFSSWPKLAGLFAALVVSSLVGPVSAAEQKPSIPIIVKDTTTYYWQIVLAGARKAGRDLNVNVPQLGAQSESDINGQISILENVVSEKPAAIVIAPTQFKALGKPIDEAAKNVKIIGIDSAADSKAFTSFLTTDNVQGGRIAADALAAAITAKYGKPEGQVALITSIPGVGSLDQRGKGFKEEIAAKYPGLKLVADKVADGPAAARIIASDLSLCLASPFVEFCRYPLALRPKIFVNRCHACSGAEDQFFSAFRIDTVLVRTHFWIRIVLVS
jgi:hypothetical protein